MKRETVGWIVSATLALLVIAMIVLTIAGGVNVGSHDATVRRIHYSLTAAIENDPDFRDLVHVERFEYPDIRLSGTVRTPAEKKRLREILTKILGEQGIDDVVDGVQVRR
jgi:hypothetical protein